MKRKNIFLSLLISASLLLAICCNLTGQDDDGNGGVGTTPTAVTFESVIQTGGTSGTADSTGLTLTFSVDPTTLTVSDITVTGATKGALSGSGTTRTLAISDITIGNGETVSIAIANPSGFTISGSPQTAEVHKAIVRVTYNTGTGNTSGTVPVDSTAYDVDATVTALDNTGNLVGTDIVSGIKQRFIGWNTDSSAVTALYTAGNTFSITENTTLYAIYTTGTDVLTKVGPAGGWIFYDEGSTQSWGRYLEAAPQSTEWASKQWGKKTTLVSGTGTAIGTGKNNTELIVAVLNTPTAESDRAAQLADALSYGSYDDWFLPSKDELNLMYVNLKSQSVGGFADEYYWSSSEESSGFAASLLMHDGYQGNLNKGGPRRVRAVRAF